METTKEPEELIMPGKKFLTENLSALKFTAADTPFNMESLQEKLQQT